MELESQLREFQERGLGVAALSYDSVPILKDFAASRRITFPLLSDPESKAIRAFGILNEVDHPQGTATHGVPFPGTFVTDGAGIIRSKHFEQAYQERRTGASLLASGAVGDGVSAQTIQADHFTLKTSASNAEAAPGQRLTLILSFGMEPDKHAYAPGAAGYRSLRIELAENRFVKPHAVVYPEARPYTFKPLEETVPVFEGEFRIRQDVTVIAPPRGTTTPAQIDLDATLHYQVCSATLCYAPASLPLKWTIKLIPLDRVRAPEALRKPQP